MKKHTSKTERDSLYRAFCVAVKDRALFDEFIEDLFTPRENEDIHQRWHIIELLEKGFTHRGVSDELLIGVATVNRGARELRNPNGGFKQVLKKLKK